MSKRKHSPDPGDDLVPGEAITNPIEIPSSDVESLALSTSSTTRPPRSQTRNAFAILMAPKPKNQVPERPKAYAPGNVLMAYLEDTVDLDSQKRILFTTDHCVGIKDLYPRSTVHYLLLPKDPIRRQAKGRRPGTGGTPTQALSRTDIPGSPLHPFIDNVRRDVEELKQIAADELERLFGAESASSAARQAAMKAGLPKDEWPPGRDWKSELFVGVHVYPSKNHLHIHVASPDMVSPHVRRKGHYQSFVTEFLVPFEAMPIANWDAAEKAAANHGRPLECWRCGRYFQVESADRGTRPKWEAFKKHLELEKDAWIKQ